MDCPNKSGNDKMGEVLTPRATETSVSWWQSGKSVVLGIAAVMLVGWYFYRQTVPPTWLHDFGADIALRAAADPNPALPEDARQATPRGLTDNPYICLSKLIPQPWDRVVFVTHEQGKALSAHSALGDARWRVSSLADAQKRLIADDRYQLVVLMNGDDVRDAQLFYTFWADLSGLARPEGYGPANAIFTAESRAGRYVLNPAPTATPTDCP